MDYRLMPSPSDDAIVQWQCPKCGRVGATGHGHSPTWSAEFERNPQPCDGEPVRRTFIAADVIRRRVGNFGGFQRPHSFYIARDDVLRLLGDYEAGVGE